MPMVFWKCTGPTHRHGNLRAPLQIAAQLNVAETPFGPKFVRQRRPIEGRVDCNRSTVRARPTPMPVLSKSRHELFAQAVANGRSLDDAYSDAGFIRNRGNASKLMRNTAIQSRVDELLQAKLPSNYTIRILHSGSGPHQLVPRRHAVERRRNGADIIHRVFARH
jgi:hypothetical protein